MMLMAADPKMTNRDDPDVPSLFRLVGGSTFTGGKSLWLAAPAAGRRDERHDKPRRCSLSPDPEPKREPG
jgi:hypothetical protein